MIDILNILLISADGVYGFRVIHLIMLGVTIPLLPQAIKGMKEIFTDETN